MNITNNKSELGYLGNKNLKGSIRLNRSNKKIIGIHNENGDFFINNELFFKSITDGFNLKYKHNSFIINEIDILIKIKKSYIIKHIYFLDNCGQNIKNLNTPISIINYEKNKNIV